MTRHQRLEFLIVKIMLAGLFFLGLVFHTSYCQLTITDVNVIKGAIRQAIDARAPDGFRPLLAGAVRLAFHDCVGGCDGCINHNNADNAGLKVYSDQLDAIYTNYSNKLSRADFYALAGITAVERGAELAGCPPGERQCSPQITFRYGRVDCPTSPNTNIVQAFPDAHRGVGDQVSFFSREFEFTERETIAIVGAHTLGRAHTGASGFDGRWVSNPDALDHTFYRFMMEGDRLWAQVDNTPGGTSRRYQWEANAGLDDVMMLNADIGMFLDIQPDAEGVASCGYFDCPLSSTEGIVAEYAQSNPVWIADFGAAFNKMIENKQNALVEPSAVLFM
ncbi:unnamed protein product [Owenia fusiformis]|uniref:Plant heme peroxidase family profile domain-containing protein n=1 Tax=Owenia fusiformis TaxID=6347 RepID=A0A8S4Q416_OWEFU|nr:unnamed protein product [Owenia fusiformis]